MFSSEIREVLDRHFIDKDEGLTYLLCLYYKVKPVCISQEIIARVGMTDIFEKKGNTIAWKIPLFTNKEFDSNWDWVVKEYCKKFQSVSETRGSYLVESVDRMKELFVQNIDMNLTKEDVLEATDIYLSTVEDPQYCKACHYFISKGVGKKRERMLLNYVAMARQRRKSRSNSAKYPTLE